MVLPSLLASPPSRSPASRLRAGTGRGVGSTVVPPSRPPVLLQITPCVIFAGTVADAAPKRAFPYKADDSRSSVEALYRFWSPLLQKIYEALGQDSKERRAVVLVPDATLESEYIRITCKETILRVLLDVVGVPSVSMQPEMLFLPYAFPTLSTLIVVHIATRQASAFVHSNDQSLPFTFQSVPLEDTEDVVSKEWTASLERQYLDPAYPQSVMVALMKTLETCPVPIRSTAVQNIVFTGERIAHRPDLPLRMCRRLKKILENGIASEPESSNQQEAYPHIFGILPAVVSSLHSLAPSVGLVDNILSVEKLRADLLVWTGASSWATQNHQKNPDVFSWVNMEA